MPNLKEIAVHNFRNISELRLSFDPGINLFMGQNGHGKTNCLEAIALACSLRSMQSLHNSVLPKIGESTAHIYAEFDKSQASKIKLEISAHGKKAWLDTKALSSAAKLCQHLGIVSFIPQELSMVTGSSSLRRRALDLAAASLFPEHYSLLKAYEKILSCRNKILKSWPLDVKSLAVYTSMLLQQAAPLIAHRVRALDILTEPFADRLSIILGHAYKASLSYEIEEHEFNTSDREKISKMLEQQYINYQDQERARRVTLFGPHLHDMVFLINDQKTKNFASRGQIRALVLAFKLAEIIATYTIRGHAPIIILDDIVSELDEHKREKIIEVIKDVGTQAFFSATDQAFFDPKRSDACFSIEHGSLKEHIPAQAGPR